MQSCDPLRRWTGLVLLLLSLLLQGSSCPPSDESDEPLSPEALGEAIFFERNPVVVAEGSEVSVGVDFRSRRPDLFFIDYEVEAPPPSLEPSFDQARRTPVTPYVADLTIRALTGAAGIHDVEISAGQINDEVMATLRVVVLPRNVAARPGAVALEGGGFHTLAILGDGEVWAWGRNARGQLGDGTQIDRAVPVRVVGLPRRALAVAAGREHSLALLDDGTVWGWGDNDFRKLGLEQAFDRDLDVLEPEPLVCRDFRCEEGLPRFVAIAAGGDHSLALTDTGVVWAWGRTGVGQLGREILDRRDGIAFPIAFPNSLEGVVNFVAIAAGEDFSLALEDDGRVWGWGSNAVGQLGDSFRNAYEFPIELFGLGPGAATAIAAGSRHSMVLTPEGTVLTAGSNAFGQLGVAERELDGFFAVPQLRDVVAIAAGFLHSLALHDDGTASTWGSNSFDQLGFPERAPPSFEFNPSLAQGVPLLRAIGAGGRHSLGLSRDCPQIWGWGDNGSGQLGLGTAERNFFAGRTLGIGDDAAETGLGDCGFPLAVTISGDGSVTSDTGQIACREDLCSEIYDRGAVVRLNAVAADGQRFVGWAGDVGATTPSVEVVVDRSRAVVARFETVRLPPVASFVAIPETPVVNELVRLDASGSVAPDGRILSYAWRLLSGSLSEGSGPVFETRLTTTFARDVELTVIDDQGLSATLVREIRAISQPPNEGGGGGGGEPGSFQLEIVFAGAGTGRVSLLGGEIECTDTCAFQLSAGQTFSIEAFADEGSFLSRIEGCDEEPENPLNVCTVGLNAGRTITVFFE